MEALVNGLGVVISKYAAHDLPEGLPFVTVIPDDKLTDIRYKAIMDIWLYFHVPLTFALLAALVTHIVSVFIYW